MNFDFELILTSIVILSGLIWLIDAVFFAKSRERMPDAKLPLVVDYAKSFFPVLLIVLLLRSFLAEPYRIPSGSDEPTLLVGDFLVANKFTYGLRLPVLHTKFFAVGEPNRGDIVLFRWPVNPSMDFIKRVIGMPGDQVTYTNKILSVNGQQAPQQLVGYATDSDGDGPSWPVAVMEENLLGVKHAIYIRSDMPAQDFSLTVPAGEYFVMGDNRDNSNDSRFWGFVPESNFVGKAFMIMFSWDGDNHKVRWNRIFSLIH